jgi:large subunit ribosomal protein L17
VRHARTGKKLGRDSAHRKALYSNLAGALIEHGRIKTTVTKAKAVKPLAEQMITLGRRGDLHARRQATAVLRSRDVVHKLFAEVAPLFKDRPGGYTRIVKLGPRPGDSAEMAYLELVDEEYVAKEREARTPEPVAVAEPEAEAVEEDPEAEEPEAEAEAEEPVAEEQEPSDDEPQA